MIYVLPVGVEDATVDRVPTVSIGIAVLCAAAFLLTWVLPSHPAGVRDATLQEIFAYWEEHPYLEASDRFKQEVLNPRAVEMLEKAREEALRERTVPDEEAVRVEQARFTVMTNQAVQEMDEGSMRRWSLVPARGLKQLGWLTHMFLHFGWMHILGNLFFFYLVGPLLEDVWGRKLFTGFYLLGGLFAGFAHFWLDTASTAMMAGASGAIAACIGAFTFRYAARRVKMGYLIWLGFRIWRGTKLVPAWVWGGFWFLSEVMGFLTTGGHSGVAVMAHMGGFAFGFVLAVGLKVSGVEKKYIAPSVEQLHTWQQHPSLQLGLEAFERGDQDAAAHAFNDVLKTEPDNADAHFGLARVELARNPSSAHSRMERVFSKLAIKGQAAEIARMVREAGPALTAASFTPTTAYKVGSALDEVGEQALFSEPYYARAGAAAGLLGAKALIRAAELGMELGGKPEVVLQRVERARMGNALSGELTTKAILLEEAAKRAAEHATQVAADAPPASGLELDRPGATSADVPSRNELASDVSAFEIGPPSVVTCQLGGVTERGLTVLTPNGAPRVIGFHEVLAIAVGSVPARGSDGNMRNAVLTDLVVSWGKDGKGPTVLRFPPAALGLATLYPGLAPLQAYRQLLGKLIDSSGAQTLADRDALLRGEFPRYTEVSELERACYGGAPTV